MLCSSYHPGRCDCWMIQAESEARCMPLPPVCVSRLQLYRSSFTCIQYRYVYDIKGSPKSIMLHWCTYDNSYLSHKDYMCFVMGKVYRTRQAASNDCYLITAGTEMKLSWSSRKLMFSICVCIKPDTGFSHQEHRWRDLMAVVLCES